jgi:hypothetical protein
MQKIGRGAMLPVLLAMLVVGVVGGAGLPRVALADGTWLDDPSVTWNTAGMAIPKPIESMPGQRGEVDPRCAQQARPAESDEDRAVEGGGWTLFGSYTGGWGVRIVRGLDGYDGMCRPMEFQAFVFVDGKLAGTLSPMPMGSRLDGALTQVTFNGPEGITAGYVRYTEQDALCCPSARSTATYKIERSPAAPVLVRENTTTEPTSAARP